MITTDKTEDGILKRLQTVGIVISGIFFVVIVAVIWQFATIAHQKKQNEELKNEIAQTRADAARQYADAKYFDSSEYKDFLAASEFGKIKEKDVGQ